MGKSEKPPSSLAERLNQARRRQFVGRENERTLFRSAITVDEQPFYLLFIHGPGGIGKTSLLHQFEDICRENEVDVWTVDGRIIDPSPEAFMNALRKATGLTARESILEGLTALGEKRVILIDNYERIVLLDRWLRETFMLQLPDNSLVVVAGRRPPAVAWRTDPGWQPLVHSISLRNLPPIEVQNYLTIRQISTEQFETVLKFTHGYPLALSLMADMFVSRPGLKFQAEKEPDIVKALLDRLVHAVPSPAHRFALEASALVRQTTESLLEHVVEEGDSHELFEWLRSLSIIETSSRGIFPHDLAREALVADLRWRDEARFRQLHDRVRDYYSARLQQTQGQEQQSILLDYVFLHRDNPVVQPFFDVIQAQGQGVGGFLIDIARENDWGKLAAMVEQFEGGESAELAAYWFEQQPRNVVVIRNQENEPAGFMTFLSIGDLEDSVRRTDPAIDLACQYLHDFAPLRTGERAVYVRYWLAAETYQTISAVQGLIAVNAIRYYLTTPGLAYSFFPTAEPDFWTGIFAYADLHRIEAADFTIGQRRYGVFGHDWRVVSPASWLDLLARRELSLSPETVARPAVLNPVLVLSKPEFSDALHDALRDFARPDLLINNPLLRSRLILDELEGEADDLVGVEMLQNLIRDTADQLKASPKDLKFYRAVYHTYIQPAPTQAKAAELLDLPMGTFRRHLKSGIERITEILWQLEVGA